MNKILHWVLAATTSDNAYQEQISAVKELSKLGNKALKAIVFAPCYGVNDEITGDDNFIINQPFRLGTLKKSLRVSRQASPKKLTLWREKNHFCLFLRYSSVLQ